MQHPSSASASSRANNRRQASVLLLLGVIFLTVAWLSMFNSYSIGVLLFGLGMLLAATLNPRRFLSVGWLTTMLGVAAFVISRQYIPNSQILTAHILTIGLGLLGIASMARRFSIGEGILTSAFFVLGLGIVEYLQAVHLTPATF